MEMNNEAKFSCPQGEDMLAYLYDELPPYGRERFEAHLESCFECIDEFAELAVSKYSVFEWKSVEFAPLPTPKFVFPIERKAQAASWFDGVRNAFAWNSWAVAGGAAAIMLLAVMGIALWNVQPDVNIAVNEPEPAIENSPANVTTSQPVSKIADSERAATVTAVEPQQLPVTVHQTSTKRKKPTVARAVTVRRAPTVTPQPRRVTANERLQNSPTLGQYIEDQDESLRLSDIFDDLDSRDLE